jgi:hypothetical protein
MGTTWHSCDLSNLDTGGVGHGICSGIEVCSEGRLLLWNANSGRMVHERDTAQKRAGDRLERSFLSFVWGDAEGRGPQLSHTFFIAISILSIHFDGHFADHEQFPFGHSRSLS